MAAADVRVAAVRVAPQPGCLPARMDAAPPFTAQSNRTAAINSGSTCIFAATNTSISALQASHTPLPLDLLDPTLSTCPSALTRLLPAAAQCQSNGEEQR
eukprot:2925566-Rhodomonas_salina.2